MSCDALRRQDSLNFELERYQIRFLFIIRAYAGLSLLYMPSASGDLQYRDVDIVLSWKDEGGLSLSYYLKEGYVNGNHNLGILFHGLVDKDHDELVHDGATFLLSPVSIADVDVHIH